MSINIDFKTAKPLSIAIENVSTNLYFSDIWGAVKVRWGIGRNKYRVEPGVYKVGLPGKHSDIFVTANYKLSFDTLRKNLKGIDAWILIIDTKGINVWCAAGKGTFGTKNLIDSVIANNLKILVDHHSLIVPQLGAVGIAAHSVFEKTGFKVIYGPIKAADIKGFVELGYNANPLMRKIEFTFTERAKLIPVDMMYAKNRLLLVLLLVFFISGLDKSGFQFLRMIETSFYPLINIIVSFLAGIVLTPLFLPLAPFRAFALKGTFWGLICTILLFYITQPDIIEAISVGLLNLSVSSFTAMNFTGSSTYTSLSGVKLEMKVAIPMQIGLAALGLMLFVFFKLQVI
jgi:hypothetical protein